VRYHALHANLCTETFGEVVQNFELKRVGGASKGHPSAPLLAGYFSLR